MGGARSGKSNYAQDLAQKFSEKVLFVATAEALDKCMQRRIEKHKLDRPSHWITLEIPVNVARGLKGKMREAEVVIIDCLTLLVSNIMLGEGRGLSGESGNDISRTEASVVAEIDELIEFMRNTRAAFIIVSNEVGLGLVPDNEPGQVYRDLLGRTNQMVAQYADEVDFMIAGIPLKVKG